MSLNGVKSQVWGLHNYHEQKVNIEALTELKGADIFLAISCFSSQWKISMSDISTIFAFRIVGMTLHPND
jgi:hypothetical protein